jgi:hypothetical protein
MRSGASHRGCDAPPAPKADHARELYRQAWDELALSESRRTAARPARSRRGPGRP